MGEADPLVALCTQGLIVMDDYVSAWTERQPI